VFRFAELDEELRRICVDEIESRPFEITFHEIWTDLDHVHFLLQSVPMKSPKQITQTIKSITAKWILKKYADLLKEDLWSREFWTDGYYISTVGPHWNAHTIERYIKNQWREAEYKRLHVSEEQLQLAF
jgi:putative transposase